MASISNRPPAAAAMPRAGRTGSAQKSAVRGQKSGKKRRKYKDTESLGTRLSRVADELDRIDWLLQTTPDLEIAIKLADRALKSDAPGCADDLAAWAKLAFGVNLDDPEQEEDRHFKGTGPDLCDLSNTLAMVINAARWRIRRAAKVLSLAAGHLK